MLMKAAPELNLDETVQGIVLSKDGRSILLVHEIGDPGGKRRGWSLFGGNTLIEHQRKLDPKTGQYVPRENLRLEQVIEDTKKQIIHFLTGPSRIESDSVPISEWSHWNRLMDACEDFRGCGNPKQDLLEYLTIVREGLEETGLLVCPISRILPPEIVIRNGKEHTVIVLHCEVIAGTIDKRSVETDDCRWFPLDKLPADLYRSHFVRIYNGVRMIRDVVAENIDIRKECQEVAPW